MKSYCYISDRDTNIWGKLWHLIEMHIIDRGMIKTKNTPGKRIKNGAQIINNKEKSNECLRKYRTSLKGRYGEIRKQSQQRNKSFTITFEEYCEAISKPCYYCEYKFGKPVLSGSGIDRINNLIGYEPDNIISCCKNCNAIKSDYLSMEETKALINLLLKMRGLVI